MNSDAVTDGGRTERTRSSSEGIFKESDIEQGWVIIYELKAKDFESIRIIKLLLCTRKLFTFKKNLAWNDHQMVTNDHLFVKRTKNCELFLWTDLKFSKNQRSPIVNYIQYDDNNQWNAWSCDGCNHTGIEIRSNETDIFEIFCHWVLRQDCFNCKSINNNFIMFG